MLTALGLVAVAALILANGYFVAAEFAFVAARRGRLEADAEQDKRAARAVQVHKRLSFMLSGAQLGITITSLVVGYIAEPTIAQALQPVIGAVGFSSGARDGIALGTAFILATVGQMVLGELAPKNLAIARPEPTARALASSTLVAMRLASPLIRFFDGSANRLLRAVGIEPVEEVHGAVSVEELELIVEESADRGNLTNRQAGLLARALDFGDLHAADAMVPWNRVVTVAESGTGTDVLEAMAGGHSRFPVVAGDGTINAVVCAKDLLGMPADQLGEVSTVHLARPLVVVPETAGLRIVLDRLRTENTEMALVADEYGAHAGIVTLEDLVEELVGDIADEYDPDEPPATQQDGDTWLIRADLRPDEIERATGIELPEGDFDTIAGLVLMHLQRLAEPGDRVELPDLVIEVVEVDGWTVSQVRLRPVVSDPDEEPHPGTDNGTGDASSGERASDDRAEAPGPDDDQASQEPSSR